MRPLVLLSFVVLASACKPGGCSDDTSSPSTSTPAQGAPTNPQYPPINSAAYPPINSGRFPPIGGGSAAAGSGATLGAAAPGGPILNELATGNYNGLPVKVPAGDLQLTYMLGPGCTNVVATLGPEILRKANAGADSVNGTAVVSSPEAAGIHPLHVTAPDNCRWSIQLSPKP